VSVVLKLLGPLDDALIPEDVVLGTPMVVDEVNAGRELDISDEVNGARELEGLDPDKTASAVRLGDEVVDR
jgi:hypothetical protein